MAKTRWSGISGSLNIPIIHARKMFDLKGNYYQKVGGRAIVGGELDFPLLKRKEMFPLKGQRVRSPADVIARYAAVIPTSNRHKIQSHDILAQLAVGRDANPTYFG